MSNAEEAEYNRLFYPFLFEGGKADLADVLAQVQHSTIEKCHEVVALRQTTLAQSLEQIVAAGKAMGHAFAQGATLLAFGNGGSATDAQDIVTDLLNPAFPGWSALPALALTNDIAVVTAVGNDVGYDNVFLRQIIAFGNRGDIAVGFSTSGNSANILLALEQARKQGLLTVGITGYEGGKMLRSGVLNYCINAPSDHIPRIQEGQATIYHALLEVIHATLQIERQIAIDSEKTEEGVQT